MTNGSVAIYRFFSEEGRLLYVGQTHNPFERWYQHMMGDKDVTRVRVIQVEWFPDAKMAVMAERWAIKTENPLWNKSGLPAPLELRETPQEAFNTSHAFDRSTG